MNKRHYSTLSPAEAKTLLSDMAVVKRHLEACGYTVFLSGGTLLGAIRDNDFIPWDWDVEFMIERRFFRRWLFMRRIQRAGYSIQGSSYFSAPPKICVGSAQKIEIMEFKRKCNVMIRRHPIWKRRSMVIPFSFMADPEVRSFKGLPFRVPSPPEEFLSWRYGDWKTPKSDKGYLTQAFAPGRFGDSSIQSRAKTGRHTTARVNRSIYYVLKTCDRVLVYLSGKL